MSVPGRSEGIGQIRAKRYAVIRDVLLPVQSIIHNEVVSAVTLLVAAIAALTWANSSWGELYREFQHLPVAMTVGDLSLESPLHHWVNDGLMALFFFVVGLEIKREFVGGELAGWKQAAFPVLAALGGMVLPALIYVSWNVHGGALRGWGIPMATDIAFALGVLALVGARIPPRLRMFLLALAIVDDIGAIAVIAVFYTEQLSMTALVSAGVLFGLIALLLKSGLRASLVYLLLAVPFWLAVLKSGVHATIAGVLLGLVTPGQSWLTRQRYVELTQERLRRLKALLAQGEGEVDRELGTIEELTRETETPLDRFERMIHPWVSFAVLPLFALVNSGVRLSGDMVAEAATSVITLGVFSGLLIGKTLGIVSFAWLAVRLDVAAMPDGVTWRDLVGVAVLGGIGFTVALFITDLAFARPEAADEAKIGILAASVCAGVLGFATLRFGRRHNQMAA